MGQKAPPSMSLSSASYCSLVIGLFPLSFSEPFLLNTLGQLASRISGLSELLESVRTGGSRDRPLCSCEDGDSERNAVVVWLAFWVDSASVVLEIGPSESKV
jgi:hypothetical protein